MPSERFAQWTLTNWFADQARFFRVDLEPVLSRGRAYVFKNGSIDFEAMRQRFGAITNYWTNGITYSTPVIFKEPEEAWQENLGAYDTNGLLIGSNEGKLTGFYGYTRINSIDWHPDWEHLPDIPRLSLASNDFRVEFTGASNGLPRESIMWASEAMFYWAITDFRTRFLNHAFVTELNLPPDLASNILHRQYRPDLNMPTNETPGRSFSIDPCSLLKKCLAFRPASFSGSVPSKMLTVLPFAPENRLFPSPTLPLFRSCSMQKPPWLITLASWHSGYSARKQASRMIRLAGKDQAGPTIFCRR